jgi:hypothetical protein
VGSAALGMNVLAAGLAHVQVVEAVDDFVGVDLYLLGLGCGEVGVTYVACERHFRLLGGGAGVN